MSRILYFEGVGLEHTEKEYGMNCRIRTAFHNIEGAPYFLEVTCMHTSKEQRRNPCYMAGFPRYKNYLGLSSALKLSRNGSTGLNIREELPPGLFGMDVRYTADAVLKLVNSGFDCRFDEIKVLPRLSGYHAWKDKPKRNGYPVTFGDAFKYDEEMTMRRHAAMERFSKELSQKGMFGGRHDNTSYGCASSGNLSVRLNISDQEMAKHGFKDRCLEIAV